MDENIQLVDINNPQEMIHINGNPVIKTFWELGKAVFPPLALAEHVISDYVNERYEKKLHLFLEQIISGTSMVSLEDLKTEERMGGFYLCLEAIRKVESTEKIRRIGTLYNNCLLLSEPVKYNEFEEWLCIINEISIREMDILITLNNYEESYGKCTDGKFKTTIIFWKDFVDEILVKYKIKDDELFAILTRLLRTGFYRNDWIEVGALKEVNRMGYTTVYFLKFKSMIMDQD